MSYIEKKELKTKYRLVVTVDKRHVGHAVKRLVLRNTEMWIDELIKRMEVN